MLQEKQKTFSIFARNTKRYVHLHKQEHDGAVLTREQNIIWGNFTLKSKHGISTVHTKKKSEPLKFPRGRGEALLTFPNLQ